MLGRRSLTPGRRQQTTRYALRMTCRPRTPGIAFSPTKISSTRVAQGIPLFHATSKRAQTASGPCQRMLPFRRQACPTHRIHPGRRTHDPWVFRRHVPAPPDEPLTLKPYVPEIIHNIQYRPPPKRLHLHRSDHEILTNFGEDVWSIRDGFTAWVESDAAETRIRHIANSSPSGTAQVFRKASEKKSMSQLLENQFDNSKPNRQQEQTRISILSWSSGPRRGRGTLVLLRNKLRVNGTLLLCKKPSNGCSTNMLPTHFYVSHFAGCAILYNKDTISSDLLGSSVYIHDRKSVQHVVKEGRYSRPSYRVGWSEELPALANPTSL